jgi:hypothetical protein
MIILYLLLLTFPFLSFATLPEQTIWTCSNEINSTIQKLTQKRDQNWIKVTSTEALPSFKSPNDKVGEWIFLQKNGDKSESIILSRSNENLEYRFAPNKRCFPQVLMSKGTHKESLSSSFSDKDLSQLLRMNPQTVLLIWSPHMRLSVRAIRELEMAKISFEVIMDPLADQEEATKFVRDYRLDKSSLRRAHSNELNQRNALNHYPALLVAKEGKLCSSVQRGYRKAQRYALIIKEMRENCL